MEARQDRRREDRQFRLPVARRADSLQGGGQHMARQAGRAAIRVKAHERRPERSRASSAHRATASIYFLISNIIGGSSSNIIGLAVRFTRLVGRYMASALAR